MAWIDRINELNHRVVDRVYYRYVVNGVAVGFVDSQLLDSLAKSPLFTISHDAKRVDSTFAPTDSHAFGDAITAFFHNYFTRHAIKGWRNERFPVMANYGGEVLFTIERAALSYLGITGYGVHVNGYVESPAGEPAGYYLWIAQRAANKPTSPNKLDQIAAGGIPYGLSAHENVVKECQEEANIPEAIAQQARAVSAISYAYDLAVGVRADVIFNYDLRLPHDFVPSVNDDEVAGFRRYHLNELLVMLENTQDFKNNSAAVVIDFAIRHGVITPAHRDYLALCQGMHYGTTQL